MHHDYFRCNRPDITALVDRAENTNLLTYVRCKRCINSLLQFISGGGGGTWFHQRVPQQGLCRQRDSEHPDVWDPASHHLAQEAGGHRLLIAQHCQGDACWSPQVCFCLSLCCAALAELCILIICPYVTDF